LFHFSDRFRTPRRVLGFDRSHGCHRRHTYTSRLVGTRIVSGALATTQLPGATSHLVREDAGVQSTRQLEQRRPEGPRGRFAPPPFCDEQGGRLRLFGAPFASAFGRGLPLAARLRGRALESHAAIPGEPVSHSFPGRCTSDHYGWAVPMYDRQDWGRLHHRSGTAWWLNFPVDVREWAARRGVVEGLGLRGRAGEFDRATLRLTAASCTRSASGLGQAPSPGANSHVPPLLVCERVVARFQPCLVFGVAR